MESQLFCPVSLETKDFASNLIYEVFNEYYDLFGLSKPKVKNLISDQFTMEGSEIQSTFVLLDKKKSPCAVLSSLPVSELKTAQIKSAIHMIRHVEKKNKEGVLKSIKDFSAKFPVPPPNYFYLSRLIVLANLRGKNLGEILLKEFSVLGQNYAGLCLHVHKKRESALRFYHKNGYTPISNKNMPYYLLAKN